MTKLLVALLFLFSLLPAAAANDLAVAAASDLAFVLPELAARFERQTGHKLLLTFGSSGNFYSQIQNGAPFDLFFSADSEYPRQLESAGLAEPGSLRVYAAGRLVLWTPRGSRIDLTRGLQVLLDPAVQRIAIANPRHAPYGRAAIAALEHEKLLEQVQSRLVFGENVSQAAAFVETGNADVALLPLSLAAAPAMQGKGRYSEVPQSAYPPIEQSVVVLKASAHKQAAREFLLFLQSPESVALLTRYGFSLPGNAAAPAPPQSAPARETRPQ